MVDQILGVGSGSSGAGSRSRDRRAPAPSPALATPRPADPDSTLVDSGPVQAVRALAERLADLQRALGVFPPGAADGAAGRGEAVRRLAEAQVAMANALSSDGAGGSGEASPGAPARLEAALGTLREVPRARVIELLGGVELPHPHAHGGGEGTP